MKTNMCFFSEIYDTEMRLAFEKFTVGTCFQNAKFFGHLEIVTGLENSTIFIIIFDAESNL